MIEEEFQKWLNKRHPMATSAIIDDAELVKLIRSAFEEGIFLGFSSNYDSTVRDTIVDFFILKKDINERKEG